MKFFKEFKEFAVKGNAFDMAVGVIIGGAFTKIVNSLVNDVFMPAIGLLTAGVDFSDLQLVLKEAVMDGETVVTPMVSINYGLFIQAIINFLIVALTVFLMVKILNAGRRKREAKAEALAAEQARLEAEAAAQQPPVPTELDVLTEIRDMLAKQGGAAGRQE
nr:large-conductance mechanosensitive channel protein MscL [bacterium]